MKKPKARNVLIPPSLVSEELSQDELRYSYLVSLLRKVLLAKQFRQHFELERMSNQEGVWREMVSSQYGQEYLNAIEVGQVHLESPIYPQKEAA